MAPNYVMFFFLLYSVFIAIFNPFFLQDLPSFASVGSTPGSIFASATKSETAGNFSFKGAGAPVFGSAAKPANRYVKKFPIGYFEQNCRSGFYLLFSKKNWFFWWKLFSFVRPTATPFSQSCALEGTSPLLLAWLLELKRFKDNIRCAPLCFEGTGHRQKTADPLVFWHFISVSQGWNRPGRYGMAPEKRVTITFTL